MYRHRLHKFGYLAVLFVLLMPSLAFAVKTADVSLTPGGASDTAIPLDSGETGIWSLHADMAAGQAGWTIEKSQYSLNPDWSIWTVVANGAGTTPHKYQATVGPTIEDENLAASVDGKLKKPPSSGGGGGRPMPEDLGFTANLAIPKLEVFDAQAFSPNDQGTLSGDPTQETVDEEMLREGVFADGTSVLVIRLRPLNYGKAVTFSISHLNGNNVFPQNVSFVGSLHGAFPALPAPDAGGGALSVMVGAGDTKVVYYRPPNN